MELRVLCPLRSITISDLAGVHSVRGIGLVKGGKELDSNLFDEYVLIEIGYLIAREFIDYPYLFEVVEIKDEKEQAEIHASRNSRYFQLINFLWFVKDCSTNQSGLITYIAGHKKILYSTRGAGFSTARGKFEETNFQKADFDNAVKIYDSVTALQKDPTYRPIPINLVRSQAHDSSSHYKNYNLQNRIIRAINILNMARSNSFIPLKISLYIAVLECLFTTDSTEVNYKVSERAAFYIGGGMEEKLNNFSKIKLAYDVRSKFFHGQELKKNNDSREKLEEISEEIDHLLRIILKNVLLKDSAIFLQNDSKLQEYFNRLIFG